MITWQCSFHILLLGNDGKVVQHASGYQHLPCPSVLNDVSVDYLLVKVFLDHFHVVPSSFSPSCVSSLSASSLECPPTCPVSIGLALCCCRKLVLPAFHSQIICTLLLPPVLFSHYFLFHHVWIFSLLCLRRMWIVAKLHFVFLLDTWNVFCITNVK